MSAYNEFNAEEMVALVHSDITFENISNGEVNAKTTGTDQFQEMAIQGKSLFSSRQQKASNFQFSEDTVTVDIDYKGVLRTDLPNGMKAGDSLQLTGQSKFRFEDNQICSIIDRS
ncbi:MAG: nuclear transport factor 2 family protein [Phormidesmis sp.]